MREREIERKGSQWGTFRDEGNGAQQGSRKTHLSTKKGVDSIYAERWEVEAQHLRVVKKRPGCSKKGTS